MRLKKRVDSGCCDSKFARCGYILLIVGGDCGTIYVYATVDTPSGAVGEVPVERFGEAHIGACVLLACPYGPSHKVVYIHLYIHYSIRTVVYHDKISVVNGRIAVGIQIKYLWSLRWIYNEVYLGFCHIVGRVPHAQTQGMVACGELGKGEVEVAGYSAVCPRSIIVHGIGICALAIKL